jgi:hypothetical protein
MSSSPKFACRGEILCGSLAIPRFYERRDFRPAWIVSGDPLPQTDSLINAIAQTDREGLKPDDYHLANIQSLLVDVRKDKVEGNFQLFRMQQVAFNLYLLMCARTRLKATCCILKSW